MARYMKRYEEKLEQGHARNAAWALLTPAQKVDSLDERLGVGQGARRQRAKLPCLFVPWSEGNETLRNDCYLCGKTKHEHRAS